MAKNGKTARNERVKLLANTVNTIGLAFFVPGFVVPFIALAYGAEPPKSPNWLLVGVWWVGQAMTLHLTARAILRGIEE